MEACLAVEREHEKVVKKLRTVSGSATEKLQRVLDQIQALKNKLMAGRTSLSSSGDKCTTQWCYMCEGTVLYVDVFPCSTWYQ